MDAEARGELVTAQPSTSGYDGLSFLAHMTAGAVAGITEHIAMYPVDTIKTRMQALSHPGQRLHRQGVLSALQAVLKREGVGGLYRGVGAVAAGAGPAHALYFAVYELAKDQLGGNRGGHQPLATAAAGSIATLVNDACMTPADVIKQRLQVAHSPYKGILDCCRQVLRTEGPSAFFKSYRTTIFMNIPFTAMHFSVYESSKKWLLGLEEAAAGKGQQQQEQQQQDHHHHQEEEEEEEEEEGLAVQVVAGGLAGGAAAAITTPLDVVKTRLQTEGVHSATRYESSAVLHVLQRIVADEGRRAIWRGLRPRVLFHVPAAAVCWGSYETMKKLLREELSAA